MLWGVVGLMKVSAKTAEEAPKKEPKKKAPKKEAKEEAMKKIMKEIMKKIMEETMKKTDGEGMAMINAVGENFAVHRRLILTVVMEVGEREEGEDLTAGNAAGEGVGKATVADGEAGEAVGGGVVDEGSIYLTKVSWTALWIIVFNSSSCFDVKIMLLT